MPDRSASSGRECVADRKELASLRIEPSWGMPLLVSVPSSEIRVPLASSTLR